MRNEIIDKTDISKFIQITFSALTGKTISLRVKSSDRIKDVLKSNLDRGFPTKEYYIRNDPLQTTQYIVEHPKRELHPDVRLFYHGKIIDDYSTFDDCYIKDGDDIHIIRRLRGGGGGFGLEFIDIGASKPSTLPFSNSAPKWRLVKKGLNIFGICVNNTCKAYKKEVIYNGKDLYSEGIIEKRFDMIENMDKIICPLCEKIITPKTCGFYLCEYQCIGDKIENGEKIHVETEPIETKDDDFEYYDPLKGKTVVWQRLEFFVIERQSIHYNKK